MSKMMLQAAVAATASGAWAKRTTKRNECSLVDNWNKLDDDENDNRKYDDDASNWAIWNCFLSTLLTVLLAFSRTERNCCLWLFALVCGRLVAKAKIFETDTRLSSLLFVIVYFPLSTSYRFRASFAPPFTLSLSLFLLLVRLGICLAVVNNNSNIATSAYRIAKRSTILRGHGSGIKHAPSTSNNIYTPFFFRSLFVLFIMQLKLF